MAIEPPTTGTPAGNSDVHPPRRPSWSKPREALGLFVRGATVRVAWRVALLVGTILSIINQGDVVARGDATTGTWIRIALNFCVPFIVASWGYLAACRVAPERRG